MAMGITKLLKPRLPCVFVPLLAVDRREAFGKTIAFISMLLKYYYCYSMHCILSKLYPIGFWHFAPFIIPAHLKPISHYNKFTT